MSDSLHAHGASVLLSTTTHPSNATAIGNIINIGGPELSRDSVDVSTMDSTAKWREFLPAMVDAGEVTMEVNYDGTAAGTADFLAGKLTATTHIVFIRFGDHTQPTNESNWKSAGAITGLGQAIPFDDKVTQSVTIKLSGVATYTDLPA